MMPLRVRMAATICCLVAAATPVQAVNPATVTYQAITASDPEGISRLRLTPMDDGSYAINLSVVAPNRTQHTGHIQGRAIRQGDQLTLIIPNFLPDGDLDQPPLCTLVIQLSQANARVVSEHACAFYHGAGASFVEQGQHLQRVSPP